MPTYVYRCPRCGRTFDKVQKISDPPRARCPRCRAAASRVITGGGGFLLKGEGFYATDYRSESYKRAARAESGETAPGPEKQTDVKAVPGAGKGEKGAGAKASSASARGTGAKGEEGTNAKRKKGARAKGQEGG